MKERKNLPYMPLFIDDWMQSSGVCDLSDATRGIYIDLMCVLFKEKVRGAYTLHSKEMRWHKSRSKTQLALAKPTETERLPYFVDFLIKPLRSTRSAILKALQELLYHEVIVVVDDILLQPRMYRDYGGHLLDEGGTDARLALPAIDAEDPTDDNNNKGNKKKAKKAKKKQPSKTTEKTTQNDPSSSRELAQSHNGSGSENNNINSGIDNEEGNIGGVGDAKPEKENAENTPQGTAAAPRRQAKGKAATAQRPVSEQPPTQEEVSAYWQERAEQGKPLLYISAEEFYATCETDGWTHGKDRKPIMNWKTFALGCDTYRRNHGDRPVGARPSAAAPPPRSGEPVKAEPNKDGQGKYRKW